MIAVLKAGPLSTVQDEGRWGSQAYGMPVAGAMDRYAYRVANILAGNRPGAAALEMTLAGDSLKFEHNCQVAVCGADMQATLNGEKINNWSAFTVPAGGTLVFGYAQEGCRAYLAVRGGIAVPAVLGSKSTYTRAAVGGVSGRKLTAGDVLKIGDEVVVPGVAAFLPEGYRPAYTANITLRVLPGPQDDLFTADGVKTLFGSEYIIADEADRMGYRLDGPEIKHSGKPDIISDALPHGAIQVPGHGRPIVMMVDHQTTGGYPKIGVVIGPDLALLAQAKPGDSVTFKRCGDEEAVEALRAEARRYSDIEAWRAGLLAPAAAVRRLSVTVNGHTYNVELSEE
jgi:biotin-dependent carboxylase-like uncharacterized protein